jgi:alkanesulfonate monooxygenase SsuD/methylene tetrahydromethanopterin reductase-like flavin-dependent oxidoreductase (luciferase family)
MGESGPADRAPGVITRRASRPTLVNGTDLVKYGFIVTTGDPRMVADLAAEAEAAGWDGVFYWDGIAIGEMEMYDPWVVMAAMAMRTKRVRLGAIVTPPSRRRPWKLARETMTLGRLSGGRLVVPVGLGALDDGAFGNVGEPTDAPTRAEMLDESLEILQGLWSGEPFAYAGRHYHFGPMRFNPTPVQKPRIPIWVVGAWPHERSMRRVLRFDGVVTQTDQPDDVRAIAEYIARERPPKPGDRPIEIAAQGRTTPDNAEAAAVVRPFAEAGATWWIDADWEGATIESLRRRIQAGPPRVPTEP